MNVEYGSIVAGRPLSPAEMRRRKEPPEGAEDVIMNQVMSGNEVCEYGYVH